MGIDSPQKKPGTTFIRGGGGGDKGSPQADPLSGEGKDSQTSTNYPFRGEKISEDKGGPRDQEGQDRRGYVLNDTGRFGGGGVDDATVAPDGTRRVKTSE